MPDVFNLDSLTAILTEAAAQALGFFDTLGQRSVEAKSPGDLVSDADRAVEQTLRQRLTEAFPDCTILGEEYGGSPTARFWAIDPIDGTRNFLSGLPFWTVSLGLMQDGQPAAGGIVAPALGLSVLGAPGQPLRTTGFTSAPALPARKASASVATRAGPPPTATPLRPPPRPQACLPASSAPARFP